MYDLLDGVAQQASESRLPVPGTQSRRPGSEPIRAPRRAVRGLCGERGCEQAAACQNAPIREGKGRRLRRAGPNAARKHRQRLLNGNISVAGWNKPEARRAANRVGRAINRSAQQVEGKEKDELPPPSLSAPGRGGQRDISRFILPERVQFTGDQTGSDRLADPFQISGYVLAILPGAEAKGCTKDRILRCAANNILSLEGPFSKRGKAALEGRSPMPVHVWNRFPDGGWHNCI